MLLLIFTNAEIRFAFHRQGAPETRSCRRNCTLHDHYNGPNQTISDIWAALDWSG